MCLESAYYDTCVFLESFNRGHKEYEACIRLLNTEQITWSVRFCAELCSGESSIGEYISNFEINCVMNGIEAINIPISNAKKTSKKYPTLKRTLNQKGFGGRDWTHLMAAVASESQVFCTTDLDFWDPANKRTAKAKVRRIAVQREIESILPIRIYLPSEALESRCEECEENTLE